MKKTILALLALVMLIASVAVIPVNAAIADPGETVEPMWNNIMSTSSNLLFTDNLTGAAEMTVARKPGTTSTTITIQVYKQAGSTWTLINEGSKTSTAMVTPYSLTFSGERGAYYKAVFTVSVNRSGTVETTTETRYITCE